MGFVLLGLVACTTPKSISVDKDNFVDSEASPAEVLSKFLAQPRLISVQGKAKAIVRSSSSSDRLHARFLSNADSSQIFVSNNLGIQGGWILLSPDSVLYYNRVDKFAQTTAIHNAELFKLQGLQALNVLDLLQPKISLANLNKVKENQNAFKLSFSDGSHLVISKESGFPQQYVRVRPGLDDLDIRYDRYALFSNDMYLPQRMEVSQIETGTQIFLLFQEITVNPQILEFDLSIPNTIYIEQL